jgi:pimeloyl-ACP methyl ester carboxylesterase
MDFIEVNGTALRYGMSGAGAFTLVLIHEMGGTLESWDFVLPMLSAKRRVLRYDTRGAGLSEKVRGNLTIDTMVADLLALIDALGIAGKVGLAGAAVGGAVALHAAARFPQRIAALAVSSPAVGSPPTAATACSPGSSGWSARVYVPSLIRSTAPIHPSCVATRGVLLPSARAGSAAIRQASPPYTGCLPAWICSMNCRLSPVQRS